MELTLLDLAKRFPTMKRILWRNRRREVKAQIVKGSTGMEPSKDMISNFSINDLPW